MDVSVIICTYNRRDSLRQTLSLLCGLEVPAHLSWEVLVVDNNSTDDTPQVCESFIQKLPLRYVFEPRQGVNHARNRGVAEAMAPLVLFADDDVNVDKNWLASVWDAAERHPGVSIFSGRIFPLWESTPPAWLTKNSKSILRPVAVHLDLGDEERILADFCANSWGANLAFRKSVFSDSCRFREGIGRKGQDEVRGGETELIQRLLKDGHRRLYVAKAIVHHRNPSSHATERYVFAYYKGSGMTEIRLGGTPTSQHIWFGAPRYYWWKLIRNGFKYAVARWTMPSKFWLPALIEMSRSWGAITEIHRIKPLSNSRSWI